MITYSPIAAFAAIICCGVMLFVVAAASFALVTPNRSSWIAGALGVAGSGYLVFWAGFLQPAFGRYLSWGLLGAAALVVVWRGETVVRFVRVHRRMILIMGLAATCYVSLLELVPNHSWSDGARSRFMSMPGDNEIPRVLADMTRSGNRNRLLGGDWLTSDRPPLQSGVDLLVLPAMNAIGFDLDTACAASGLWLQLLWIPAVYLLLRRLGLNQAVATAAAALLPFTGFLFFNSVFVWPKMAAGAFVLIAATKWFLPAHGEDRYRFVVAGICAGMGWLLHGGIMFGLLALAPFVVATIRQWRGWVWSGLAFVLLISPWLAYQHWYCPPGNRLAKWHIGGDIGPDDLTFTQAISHSYRKAGWAGALDARRQNARMLTDGDWHNLRTFWRRENLQEQRENDVALPLRTAALWWCGVAGMLVVATIPVVRRKISGKMLRAQLFAITWLALTLAVWVSLMFFPNQVFTHQGTYTTQLLLVTLLVSWAGLAHRGVVYAIGACQMIHFFIVWLALDRAKEASHPFSLMMLVLGTLGLVLVAVLARQQVSVSGPVDHLDACHPGVMTNP